MEELLLHIGSNEKRQRRGRVAVNSYQPPEPDMPIKFAKTISSYDISKWAFRYTLSGIALAGIALGFSTSTARASDSTQHAPTRSEISPWGTGPMTISLIESARRERPIPGGDPIPAAAQAVRPARLVVPSQEVAAMQAFEASQRAPTFAPARAMTFVLGATGALAVTPVTYPQSTAR